MSIKRLTECFDAISRSLSVAGGWALLALSLLVGIDVVGRQWFRISLHGADEIGGYVMAVVCAFGFSYALAQRAHIRLNILLVRLPTSYRVLANFFAYSILTAFAYMMLWRGLAVLKETVQLKAVAPTPLETPMVIPQSLWSLGLLWFAAHVTVYLGRMIECISRKEFSDLVATFGVESSVKSRREEGSGFAGKRCSRLP